MRLSSLARSKAAAVITTVAVVAGLVSAPAAHAAPAEELLTDNVVAINEWVSAAGFAHPGIGLSAHDLRAAQAKVRSGVEPWTSYFEAMASTGFASKTYRASNSKSAAEPDQPLDNGFSHVGLRYRETNDALGALTQALLWLTTGDEVYRRNAIQALRTWSRLDPTKFAYFADAHIHTGKPLQQFLMAAELIRTTDPLADDTPGAYGGYDVGWHSSDDEALLTNFARPVVNVFLFSNTTWMNQHNFGLYGRIGTAIYADDRDGYAKGVEWLTVNSSFSEYSNGAIAPQIPLIKADNPANPYGYDFVQVREMGRDQAHGECNIENYAGLARMLEVQGTKVDPVAGTVSTATDAVSVYDFLDHRILAGANVFAGFMMGAPTPWIDERGWGGTISQAYRGRIFNSLTELYYVYKQRGVDVETVAPWIAKLHQRIDGPTYYYGTGVANFWAANNLTSPEYWVAFPESLTGTPPTPLPATASLPFSRFSLQRDDRTTLVTENGETFARAHVDPQGTTNVIGRMMWISNGLIGVRLRSDGPTRLEVLDKEEASGKNPDETQALVLYSLEVPNTHGQWRYVTYPSGGTNSHFYRLTGNAGTTVDLDSVTLSAKTDLTPPTFEQTSDRLYVVLGHQSTFDLSATDPGGSVTYEAAGLPEGATLDPQTGVLTWTPVGHVGRHPVQIVADDGVTVAARTFELVVSANRLRMIDTAVEDGTDRQAIYTSVTHERFAAAYTEARKLAFKGSDEDFNAAFTELLAAIAALRLLNPRLADGSLDYSEIATPTVLSVSGLKVLVDGDNTTGGGDQRVGSIRLDFGPAYRVAAESFALQARFAFPMRSQGTNVYGSNDGITWTLLTEHETTETNDLETIPVVAEHRGERFRFLKLQVDHPGVPIDPAYPGIWSIAEFHINGSRSEVPGTITAATLSSADALRGRVTAGDTVTLNFTSRKPISGVAVTLGGQSITATGDGGLSWTATTTLGDITGGGILPLTIDYTMPDGKPGATVTAPTDYAALFGSDERNLVNLVKAKVVDNAGNPDSSKAAHGQLVLDANTTTFSDVAPVNGLATLTWDLGNGRTISLDRAEILVRQDSNGLTRQVDQALEGSNDLQAWTRLTGTTGKELDWQNLPATDHGQYRYLRVRNGDRIDLAELRVFGTFRADLAVVLAEADATDLTHVSRASAILFKREVEAVRAASQQAGADTDALALRLVKAWDLLQAAPVEAIPIDRSWVVASTISWDGKKTAADNGWAMLDGDPATYTDTKAASGWVKVVPTQTTTFAVDSVRFLPRANYASRASGIQFQGSNDGGATWQTFATAGTVTAVAWTEIKLPETVRYGAVRVYATTGGTNLAEVQFIRAGVDATGLDLYLTETASLAEADWTAHSWAALASARQAAVALRADGATPDQAQVDAATDALAAAVAGLERQG